MDLKTNSGLLFKNDKKEKPNHPDYTGQCLVDGRLWRMSAWLKDGKNGKFMSFSFQEPYEKAKKDPDETSSIPF
jgi:hypothetical protein